MNSMMAEFIRLNSKSGEMHHLHATGNGQNGVNRMQERLSEHGMYGIPEWEEIVPYINNMGTVMTAADLILCRAGASTLAELTNIGRASVLVPSPNVTNNHQEKNARQVENIGGAVVLTESECSGEILYNTVLGLIRDPERIARMEEASKKLGQPEAGEKIAQVILSHIN
jgi:UDP-N-acetylglucosamine--N-acetylmuramyl-(pentapeptide) pyrophosphoryl-undecaprenol N-acetylglucosamine transferase